MQAASRRVLSSWIRGRMYRSRLLRMCRDRWSSSAVMQGNKRLQQLTASLSSELRGLTDTEDSNEYCCEVGRRVQTQTPSTSLLLEQYFHHIDASPILPHCEHVVVGGGATSTPLPCRVVGEGATSTPLPCRVVGGGATSTPLPLPCSGRVSETSVQLIIDTIETPSLCRPSKKLKTTIKKPHKAVPSGRKVFREMLHKAKVVNSRFKNSRPPKSPPPGHCLLAQEWAKQSFHYNPSHPNNHYPRDFLLPSVQTIS